MVYALFVGTAAFMVSLVAGKWVVAYLGGARTGQADIGRCSGVARGQGGHADDGRSAHLRDGVPGDGAHQPVREAIDLPAAGDNRRHRHAGTYRRLPDDRRDAPRARPGLNKRLKTVLLLSSGAGVGAHPLLRAGGAEHQRALAGQVRDRAAVHTGGGRRLHRHDERRRGHGRSRRAGGRHDGRWPSPSTASSLSFRTRRSWRRSA